LAACILLFWKDSPAGIVGTVGIWRRVMDLDLVGLDWGANNKWPGIFSDKSVAGTVPLGEATAPVGLLLWTQSFAAGRFVLQTRV
jgi:hypothetical protein